MSEQVSFICSLGVLFNLILDISRKMLILGNHFVAPSAPERAQFVSSGASPEAASAVAVSKQDVHVQHCYNS